MKSLPIGFIANDFKQYAYITDDNFLFQTLKESGNIFEFIKCAFNDEKWRVSNDLLLRKFVSRLENSIPSEKLPINKINEISMLYNEILNNETYVFINFFHQNKNINVKVRIDNALVEKLKQTINFNSDNRLLSKLQPN